MANSEIETSVSQVLIIFACFWSAVTSLRDFGRPNKEPRLKQNQKQENERSSRYTPTQLI